jgi:hypothetical protein
VGASAERNAVMRVLRAAHTTWRGGCGCGLSPATAVVVVGVVVVIVAVMMLGFVAVVVVVNPLASVLSGMTVYLYVLLVTAGKCRQRVAQGAIEQGDLYMCEKGESAVIRERFYMYYILGGFGLMLSASLLHEISPRGPSVGVGDEPARHRVQVYYTRRSGIPLLEME